jgi:hypothetical protein
MIMGVVVLQPLGVVYVMVAVELPATPVTIPVDAPTVADDGLLLLQVPPVVPSERVIDWPLQTLPGPVIADRGLTVKT